MKHAAPGLVGAALVVLVGIWAGAHFSKRHAPLLKGGPLPAGSASAPSGAPVSGDDEALEAVLPHHAIPEHLPAFSLHDLNGRVTPIASWNGKSLVINFWATWCAPCRREVPLLKTLASEWTGRGLDVVGIAVDHPDQVRNFAAQFGIDYPLLVGEQDALDVAAQFGMDSPAFPFTVFSDRRGEVVALFIGELHRPEADFILTVVQDLDQDRLKLPQARATIAAGLSKLAAAG
jgi:thiol-disulfide isomerase/thioredoxin